MSSKEKKIKDKKCKSCKELFTPHRPLQMVCSQVCAVEYIRKKQEEKEGKDWRERKKVMKENLKTLSQHELDTRRVFQLWIRKRDADLPCISCGTTKSDVWHASHYFKAEIFSGLIFEEMNVHKSCLKCNVFLNGNELGYREGLLKRYGAQYLATLEGMKDQARNHKFEIEELAEIKKEYKLRLKE